MEEYLRTTFFPRNRRTLQRLTEEWRKRGYRVEDGHPAPFFQLSTPLGDDSWRRELEEATSKGDIEEGWRSDWLDQEFSEEEIASAEVFSIIHVGVDLNILTGRDRVTGVCHLTDVDTSTACARCGAGARPGGPVRLLASQLNRARRFASIDIGGSEFYFIADSLAEDLTEARGETLPLRCVRAIGKQVAREGWSQIVPEFVVPIDAVREKRIERAECAECGAVRRHADTGPGHSGGHYVLLQEKLSLIDLPPVMLNPFWEGNLNLFPDGRVISYPNRRMWIRGDFARELMSRKIDGLHVTPILCERERQ